MFGKVLVKDTRPLITELALRARAMAVEPQEVFDILVGDLIIQLDVSAVAAELIAVEALSNVVESLLFPTELFSASWMRHA
jgi:hypothetical protein